MTTPYPKRLIEVDLPIKKISAHARREKSIRHGHISTLHIWWARRPLAACRAVICAALWPDPVDALCPQAFRDAAATILADFAEQVRHDALLAGLVKDHWTRWSRTNAATFHPATNFAVWPDMREALLDFIADFANWDASTVPAFLSAARALTQAAHESLGGLPGTRPLVVDPFAGGGAIPLEALRVGADAFASDLNPVAVLLNKVVLEYIPKYGQRLADEVRQWGHWIKEQAEQELAEFYPKDPDGATPIAYLWARSLPCTGPACGAKIPLINQLWIAKRKRIGVVIHTLPEKRFEFEVKQISSNKEIGAGTVRNGAVTCPFCGFTTPVQEYRSLAKDGYLGEVLYAVVLRGIDGSRKYRAPTDLDHVAFSKAKSHAEQIKTVMFDGIPLIPEEPLSEDEPRRLNVRLYGFYRWEQLFNDRQKVALAYFQQLIQQIHGNVFNNSHEDDFATAVSTVLALCVSNIIQYNSNMSTYLSDGLISVFIQGSSIPMRADYAEANPLNEELVGGFEYQLGKSIQAIKWVISGRTQPGDAIQISATKSFLPNASVDAVITDPPYYFAIPYADLSDFFYVWLRRFLIKIHPDLFLGSVTPKAEEAIQNLPHSKSTSKKDRSHFEKTLTDALKNGHSMLKLGGIEVVVFAHASTEAWESLIKSLIEANLVVTGSWPIDTERPGRMLANRQSVLASSIHLVCRPRENPDGSIYTDEVGDWRDVLQELPQRIHVWLPHLAQEGVVGADAIFACLGPALEIFSRYSRVEKASGEQVTLKEYLEYVWAAVSKEALGMIFEGAETTGFEEDARLTAMWLWTLNRNDELGTMNDERKDESGMLNDESDSSFSVHPSSFTLEYDAARKIAQGLGAHLEHLGRLVEIKGDTARLLPVSARAEYLFGKEARVSQAPARPKKRGVQLSMFETEAAESAAETWGDMSGFEVGHTALDRVHQSMLLFAAGRSDALKRFLVDEGVGQNARFWQLANALSALYPPGADEKRWVEGVLARKKGLGF